MPRGRGRKGKESRQRLLRAAVHEFAEHGYHDARVSRIVQGAGLAQGAFYLYFPSKEAIFAELVAGFRERFQTLADSGRLVTPLAGGAAARAQVVQNLEGLFRLLAEDPDLTRVALMQAADREEIFAGVVRLVAQNLQANQAAGHVRRDLAAPVVAECLVGAVERAALRLLLPGAEAPERLAAQVADLVMNGMMAEEDGNHADRG